MNAKATIKEIIPRILKIVNQLSALYQALFRPLQLDRLLCSSMAYKWNLTLKTTMINDNESIRWLGSPLHYPVPK